MVGGDEIATLQARKRALVLESTLNRVVWEAEWQNLRAATAWTRSAGQACRRVVPWLLLLAPLAGLVVARGSGQSRGLFSRLLSVLRWVRPLLGAWELWRGARAQDRSPTPTKP